MNKLKPVLVLSDGDGHWYIIPKKLGDSFYTLLQKSEREDDYTLFETMFAGYRTGGDINLVELYAKF